MTVPTVEITKTDGNVGNTAPGTDGILVLIAPSEKGTANVAGGYARPDLVQTEFGYGKLNEGAQYHIPVSRRSILAMRGTASTAASYGTVAHVGAGTSVVTAGVSPPLDDFDVVVTVVTGGTIGVAGIEYTFSLNGGKTQSPRQALGTATTLTIPTTGVTLALAAGTVLAGQTESVAVKGPRMTSADLVLALEALRVTDLPYEGVSVLGADADATMISTFDLWLQAREAEGKFKFGLLNALPRASATQTEAQYGTAMQTAFGASATIRVLVGGDQCELTSPVRGVELKSPITMPIGARAMLIDVSESPAYVARGPLPGVFISDEKGNPKYHDEAKFPTLDDRRLAALRTINGKQGVYVNQPLLLSQSGSDWVYLQHARVANKAAEMVFQLLTDELNKGVQTGKPRSDGKVFILEEDAAAIEQRINVKLEQEFFDKKRVSGIAFLLTRTDDLSGTGPVTVTSELQVSPLRYIGKFKTNEKLVRAITATATT